MERMPNFTPRPEDQGGLSEEELRAIGRNPQGVMRRRGFLSLVAAGAAVLGVEHFLGSREAAGAGTRMGVEGDEVYSFDKKGENSNEKLEQVLAQLEKIVEGVEEKHGKLFECSLAEEDMARAQAISEGVRDLAQTAAEQIVKMASSPEALIYFVQIEKILYRCSCQGFLYAAYEKAFRGSSFGEGPKIARNPLFYSARLRDYCPSEPLPEDIDQRFYIRRQKRLDIPSKVIDDLIKEYPGWASPLHQAHFRSLMENEDLQREAEKEDLNIAEYFSLLKAVGRAQEKEGSGKLVKNPEREREIGRQILDQRKLFMNKFILGPETRSIILFTGMDKGKDGKNKFTDTGWLAAIGSSDIRGVSLENIHAVHEQFEEDTETNKMRRNILLDDIADSIGETVIAFNAHGSKSDYFYMSANSPIVYSVEQIAQSLLERLCKSRQADDLKHVTIITDNCMGYNFKDKLMACIEKLWTKRVPKSFSESASPAEQLGVSFNQVDTPDIHTAAHEGSISFIGRGISGVLGLQKKGIRADQGLLGGRLLRSQALFYQTNDFTFSLSGKGALQEIGVNEASKNEHRSLPV